MSTPSKREDVFKNAVRESEAYGDENWKLRYYAGGTNAGRFVEGAFYVESNLDNPPEDGLALCTRLYSGSNEELYVSLIFNDHWEDVKDWLDEMIDLNDQGVYRYNSDQGNPEYGSNNKKTNFYLTKEGVRILNANPSQKQFQNPGWNDWEGFSDPIEVDRVLVAAYPESALTVGSAAAEQIDILTELVGQENIEVLHPWGDEDGTGVKSRLPTALTPQEIEQEVEDIGGHYAPGLISRYHGGLNFLRHKHFVILKGASGTGKTSLAKRYAEVVHGLSDRDLDSHPHFHMCRVRPEWTDPTGLIGYYDSIGENYVVEDFLEAVLDAQENPGTAVFVCLDEMNLARVEYYFSDILSAMEQEKKSDRKISLHNRGTVQGSDGRQIEGDQIIPENLYITGTVNVDETTNPLSQKVRDRAVIIDMTKVEIGSYLQTLSQKEELHDEELHDNATRIAKGPLKKIHNTMSDHGVGFGYRVAREVVEYVSFWLQQVEEGDLELEDLDWIEVESEETGDEVDVLARHALDHQLTQKIAVKLEGTDRQRKMLKELARHTLSEDADLDDDAEIGDLLEGEESGSVKLPEMLEALREKYGQLGDIGGFGMT